MKIKKAIIPLAGLGIRLLPITKAIPKEMFPVFEKPAIHYVIEECKLSGIENFLLITGKGKESIENYFDYSYELEDKLKKEEKYEYLKKIQEIYKLGKIYYTRQKEPKGLGDAILLAKNFVNNEPFVVALADDIFNYKIPVLKKLIDLFEKYDGIIMAVKKIAEEKIENYGIIKGEIVKNNLYKVTDLIEKPRKKEAPSNLAIIGRYILKPEIFDVIPNLKPGKNNEIQLTDAIKELLGKIPIFAFEIEDLHFDIGNKVDFILANIYFASIDKNIKKDLFEKIDDFIKNKKRSLISKAP
ncbi:MAG: UTP--glucose-1-phosphate uridylyltransferase GalU [Caldisericia bacterium]